MDFSENPGKGLERGESKPEPGSSRIGFFFRPGKPSRLIYEEEEV
jgi:hypothetical protein